MPTVTVKSRSGQTLATLKVDSSATVDDLKDEFAKAKPKFYPSRQRFTLPLQPGERKPVALASGKKLSDFGVRDGTELTFKDLGPQIGYSTVFFWEYFGPALVYALVYFFPQFVYPWAVKGSGSRWGGGGGSGGIPPKGQVQKLALAYWTFHYAKRIFETFFVHRFSHGTMPLTNLFKNCSYYWGFAGFVSYFVNHPNYTAPSADRAVVLFALAMLCQLCNARAHLILANLRPAGKTTGYAIPRGFPFDWPVLGGVTCANYTFEIYGWILFAFATRTVAAFLFIAAGAAQMLIWAKAKHARLRRTFDGAEGREKYPKRFVMLPPLV